MRERNGVTHVCPRKDIICGERPENWCEDCPLHAAPLAPAADADLIVQRLINYRGPPLAMDIMGRAVSALAAQAQEIARLKACVEAADAIRGHMQKVSTCKCGSDVCGWCRKVNAYDAARAELKGTSRG